MVPLHIATAHTHTLLLLSLNPPPSDTCAHTHTRTCCSNSAIAGLLAAVAIALLVLRHKRSRKPQHTGSEQDSGLYAAGLLDAPGSGPDTRQSPLEGLEEGQRVVKGAEHNMSNRGLPINQSARQSDGDRRASFGRDGVQLGKSGLRSKIPTPLLLLPSSAVRSRPQASIRAVRWRGYV